MNRMRALFLILLLTLLLPLAASTASAEFSIDAASPDVPAVSEGDSLLALGSPPGPPPPTVVLGFASYGLVLGEELDAYSNGGDILCPNGDPTCFNIITFSVDRLATGLPGSPVAVEVGGNGAAGDVFTVKISGTGVTVSPVALLNDAPDNELTIGPPAESSIDALGTSRGAGPPLYFSIDPAAVPGAAARWGMPGLSAADLLLGPGPVPSVFATAAAMGLTPGDDIDGVAINDRVNIGVYDPGIDLVNITLAPGSPSLVGLGASPGDIIEVSPGPLGVFYTTGQMKLAPTDDMDALSMLDPPLGEPIPALGAWGLPGALVGVAGVAGLLGWRRRSRVDR